MLKYGKVIKDIKNVQQLKEALIEFDTDLEVMSNFEEPIQINQMLDHDSGDEMHLEISGQDT